MKALVQYALQKNAVEIREVARPEAGPGEVLLRVKAVGVCGSDLHQRANRQSWTVNAPVILGHEFSGVVEELGPSGCEGFHPGDRVTCETSAVICGRCLYCRTGQYQLCAGRKGFGYGVDGAMAEWVRVPVRILHSLPAAVSFEAAAMTEPACVAYHSVVLRGSPTVGDVAVVIGPGTIGLLCLKMAALAGATTCVLAGTERDAGRLEIGKRMGATHTVTTENPDWTALIQDLSEGVGADLVVDAAGVSDTFPPAMKMVRPGGTIVKVGWGREPLNATLDPIVLKTVKVQGSFSHNYPMWERVIRLMAHGALDVRPMYKTYPLSHWQEAFDAMESGENVKSVLLP